MEKFERGGMKFTVFQRDGEIYLCTGDPTGEFKFTYAGEFNDYYEVVGATSVVSGDAGSSIDELYTKWLDQTSIYRELGIKY